MTSISNRLLLYPIRTLAIVIFIMLLMLQYDIMTERRTNSSEKSSTNSSKINDLANLPAEAKDSNYLKPLKTRDDIPEYLNEQKSMRVGAEIGVMAGRYSEWMLRKWTNCRLFGKVW